MQISGDKRWIFINKIVYQSSGLELAAFAIVNWNDSRSRIPITAGLVD